MTYNSKSSYNYKDTKPKENKTKSSTNPEDKNKNPSHNNPYIKHTANNYLEKNNNFNSDYKYLYSFNSQNKNREVFPDRNQINNNIDYSNNHLYSFDEDKTNNYLCNYVYTKIIGKVIEDIKQSSNITDVNESITELKRDMKRQLEEKNKELEDIKKKLNEYEKYFDLMNKQNNIINELSDLSESNKKLNEKLNENINNLNEFQLQCKNSLYQIYYDSCIKLDKKEGNLISEKNINSIRNIIGGSKKLSLLYQASKENFLAKNFHKSVFDKNKILVLISTDENTLFGFYTRKSFDYKLSVGKYIKDDKALLFTLLLNNSPHVFKFPIKLTESSSAIFVDSDLFFALGEGYDLYIPNSCNKNYSTSNFPHTYNINVEVNGEDSHEKIAYFKNIFSNGKDSFKITELEAFEVQTFYSN